MLSLSFRLALLAPAVAAFTHLKGSKATALATNSSEDALVYTGVKSAFEMFELHAPTAAAAKAPAAGAGNQNQQKQPVGVQVDEKLMEQLEKDLSKDCSKRYSAMMKGEGPEMHTFNQHAKDSKGEQCEEELKGSECHTLARITESQQVPDGRKMTARTKVEGMSCLPKECTSKEDLAVLAAFMHRQTKEIFPDQRIKVALHVDCSSSGGAVVDAAGAPPDATSAEKEKPKAKSGTPRLLNITPLLALVLFLLA